MFSKARLIGAAAAIAALGLLVAPAVPASAHPAPNHFPASRKSVNLVAGTTPAPPHPVGATAPAPPVTTVTYWALDGDDGAADQYLHAHCDASCAAYVTSSNQAWGFINPGSWYFQGTWHTVWEVQLYGNGECLTYDGLSAEFFVDPCSSGNKSQWFYFPDNIYWLINAQGSINARQFVYLTERNASPGSLVDGEIGGAGNRAVWVGRCSVNC